VSTTLTAQLSRDKVSSTDLVVHLVGILFLFIIAPGTLVLGPEQRRGEREPTSQEPRARALWKPSQHCSVAGERRKKKQRCVE
jgi:hypothetical protein